MTTLDATAPAFHDSTAAEGALPLDEIRSLVDERGRYEGWLQAIEARRGATPAHVLDRVRQDYAARLGRVAERLDSHAGPLRAHESALAERHAQVEHRLGEQRDALAEIELRTLVGEYAADEGEQRLAGAQQAIAALERELGGSSSSLAEVRGLVTRVAPATTAAPSATAPAAGAPAAVPAQPAGEPVSAPAVPATSGSAESAATEQDPADVAPTAALVEPPQTGTAESGTGAGAGFDHGAVDAARVALGDTDRSLTPSFTDAVRAGGGASAFSGGRAPAAESAAMGQEKTLRCQDCGALNYPTEWYCEKCGGELAAL